jgi:hypothetical protein
MLSSATPIPSESEATIVNEANLGQMGPRFPSLKARTEENLLNYLPNTCFYL